MRQQISLIALLILIGGCVSYHPQPLLPGKTADSVESRKLDDPGLRLFFALHGRNPNHWPKRTWDLADLTLVALYESPDLYVQRTYMDLSVAGIATAGQRPNPSLSFFTALNSIVIAPEETSPWALGMMFDLPFETAGKRGIRIREARNLSGAARFRLGQTAWNVRSRVRRSFLSYVHGIRQTQNLEEEVTVRARILRLWQQRYLLGEASAIKEDSARIDLERARLSLNAAHEQEAAARVALAQATGLPDKALDGVRLSYSDVEEAPSADLLPAPSVQRAALINRLDIREALARYAASEEALRLEIANQYPNVHLGPGYAFDQGDNMWALSFSVPLPILNQNQGPIAEAKARRTQAYALFTALQFQVMGQIELSLAHYRGAIQTFNTTRNLLVRQKAYQRMIGRRFEEGEVDRLALLDAQLILVATKRSHLAALMNAQKTLESLEDAVQVPLVGSSGRVHRPPARKNINRSLSHGPRPK